MARRFLVAALLVVYTSTCARAQSIAASLSGTVEDAQSLAVRDAKVEVSNVGTGAQLRLQTDADGNFRVPSLPPGNYRVIVSKDGFSSFEFAFVSVTVGQNRSLRAVLQPAQTAQQITVSAEGVSVLKEDRSEVGATYNQKFMNDLPVFAGSTGRNFRAQVYLTPAVTPSTQAHRPFSVGGARTRNNNYLIDSNDYNEIEGGLLMGRAASEQLISLEAIAGMQVLTHNWKAEYGRQNGSIISLITKQGSNEWHGLLYEYLRNEALGARNTFDLVKQPLKLHQFGGNIGGPLRRNRTFLFGNYEQIIRRQTNTATIQTLSPAQKSQAAPAVRALAQLYPNPNLPGTNLFRSSVGTPSDLYTFVVRVDHELTASQKLFSRTTLLSSENNGVTGASQVRYSGAVGSQGHSLHHIWTPAARTVNEARFNYTRFRILDSFVDPVQLGDPSLNGQVGFVAVNGLTSLGHFAFWGRNTAQNNFQWTNDLSHIHGAHSLKSGMAIRRLQLNSGAMTTGFTGQLRFNNIADFLAARPASYNRNVGVPYIGQRALEVNLYAQDDWQVTSRLMLNLGVRYELNTVPGEVNGLIEEKYRFRGDHNNLAPRLGFAWRADQEAKTVVRGGYGIYYNVLELAFLGLTRFNPPLITNLVAVSPTFPNLLANAQAGIPSGLVIPASDARQPYAQHFSLEVERQLFNPRTSLTAGYLGTRGLKLPRNSRPNGGDALPHAQRPDPTTGVVNLLEAAANSNYHALQLTLNAQTRGFTLRTSYTLSKFLDTVTDFPSSNQQIDRGLLALDERNWRLNYGHSDLDMRNVLTVAYAWELPFLKRNRLLGGWSLQGINTLQSGRPYTLYSGTDNLFGSNNNRVLDLPGTVIRNGGSHRPAVVLAPGVTRADITPSRDSLGTIGRNTERGDSLMQVNVAMFKDFVMTERFRLQFRAETFNLTNTVNYDLPDGLLTSPNFGQSVGAFDSRQTQLALRLNF